MATYPKDLGIATAYGYALSKGYEGTEDEFAQLMADYATVGQAAEEAAENSEAWADGEKNGTPVSSDAPQYHNNAKYWAEQAADDAADAANSQSGAETSQEAAEAWAKGTKDGTPVDSGDPTYHNNAQYYAQEAGDSATAAAGYESGSETNALKSEGFAVGQQNGTNVASGSPYYHNNAKYYETQAKSSATTANNRANQAEAWANGEVGGVPVDPADLQYHNNAKYYSEQAGTSATAAGTSESNAEAWAVGERGGVPVTSDDDTYENNAKYYAEQAAQSALTLTIDPTLTQSGQAADAKVTGDEISDLKSHLEATQIVNEASGAIATFPDGADGVPMRSVVVDMEPIQNLNGQANPYPAGGGKNKLQNSLTSQTLNNVVLTVNSDGSMKIKGLASAKTVFRVQQENAWSLPAGEYIFSVGGSQSGVDVGIGGGNSEISYEVIGTISMPVTKTLTSDGTIGNFAIIVNNGTDADVTLYPMIRLASVSDSTFAPYSNICPISGRSEVGVWRSGVNVFKTRSTTFNGITYTANADGTVTLNGTSTGYSAADVVTTLAAGTYKLYITSSESNINNVHAQLRNSSTDAYIIDTAVNSNGVELTLSEETSIKCRVLVNATGRTFNNVTVYPSLCLSSDIQSITIPLGQTVYGGTVDAVSGVMTVTRACANISEEWNWSKSISYPGGFYVDARGTLHYKAQIPFISSHAKTAESLVDYLPGTCYCDNSLNFRIMGADDSVADWKNYIVSQKTNGTPIQVCYELDTPIVVQLTPQEVKSLIGTNNVWSDGGNVSVDYVADTKLYIEQLTEPDADMVADANITSGQYFMVGNNLYLATANIANGAAVVPGTNCTKTNLAAALNAINA